MKKNNILDKYSHFLDLKDSNGKRYFSPEDFRKVEQELKTELTEK